MARTKQTARKNTGGKPIAMGRGKDPAPKPKPKPGHADHKVIIEYSSDEFDEENPQPARGYRCAKEGRQADSLNSTNISSACDYY